MRLLLVLGVGLGWIVACTPITPVPAPASPASAPAPTTTATAAALPSPTPEPSAPPQPVTLNVWHSLLPAEEEALAEDVGRFHQAFPRITVTLHAYTGNEAFVQGPASRDEGFQLALGNADLAGRLWSQDKLQPLDDWFVPDFFADFVTPAKTGVTRDDLTWGLPDSAGFHLLMFYNTDLVASAPTTTDEMLALAESFTDKDHWGLALNSYDPLWLVPWLAPYGGWLTDEQGSPTLDTPAMIDALTLYLSWHGRLTGVAPPTEYVQARQLFVDGQAAMLIDGAWAINELAQVEGLNWSVAELPEVGDKHQPAAPLVLGRYWLVGSGLTAGERQAVSTLLMFLTEPERQLSWAERFGSLPSRRTALQDARIVDDPWLGPSARQMQTGRGLLLGVDANRILDVMRGPLQQVLDGDMVPKEAAQAMQAALEP